MVKKKAGNADTLTDESLGELPPPTPKPRVSQKDKVKARVAKAANQFQETVDKAKWLRTKKGRIVKASEILRKQAASMGLLPCGSPEEEEANAEAE